MVENKLKEIFDGLSFKEIKKRSLVKYTPPFKKEYYFDGKFLFATDIILKKNRVNIILKETEKKMGQFDDHDGPEERGYISGVAKAYKEEKCRPDFEKAIKNEKIKQNLLQKLHHALQEIILSDVNVGFSTPKLKDLLGSVYVHLLLLEQGIDQIMKEQEDWKE
jgi:hypothetical protein